MNAAELIAPARHVLLDFDGPVCAVFGHLSATEVARRLAASVDEGMPADVVGTDPLALLGVFSERGRDTLRAAEAQLRELELEAVANAPITPGAVEALHAFRGAGRTVTIVSNNSAVAVRRFLAERELSQLVTGVSSRELPDPELLKPSPFLLRRAMAARHAEPSECVMIGDSLTDITAATRADVPVFALANNPPKGPRFADALLSASGVVITSMHALAVPVAVTP